VRVLEGQRGPTRTSPGGRRRRGPEAAQPPLQRGKRADSGNGVRVVLVGHAGDRGGEVPEHNATFCSILFHNVVIAADVFIVKLHRIIPNGSIEHATAGSCEGNGGVNFDSTIASNVWSHQYR
jgi:hypothetical protein